MVKLISHSADETEQIGEKIAKKLHGTEVIALFGGLGMGKTAFTRGLARALGVDDGVSSPTFALVNEYSGKYNIYHFDMYRIDDEDSLVSTGFFDYIENGICAVEWSEKIEEFIPDDSFTVTISKNSEDINSRAITIERKDE